MAAPSNYVKNSTMGTLALADGTGTPVTLSPVPFERGDISITGLGPRLNEIATFEARGRFISHAWAARIYPEFTFTAWLPNIIGSSSVAPGTLQEFASGLGAYAANVATTGVNRPMTVNATWTIEGSNFADANDEVVLMKDVHLTFDLAEAMDGNTVSMSGKVLGDIVITNGAGVVVTYRQIAALPTAP